MKIELVNVEKLIPYARNPRNNSNAVDKVAASIREYGFRQPILVDEQYTIIAGHTRLLAAKKLGLSTVPVHIADGLTQAQIKALRLADNRVGQEATWDDQMLSLELKDLEGMEFDLNLTGFNPDELDTLLHVEQLDPPVGDEDAVPEAPEDPRSKPGDVWILGKHRVLCGDALSMDSIDTLTAGCAVDLLFTDPPYNVSFNGRSGKFDVIENDNLSNDEFATFIKELCGVITTLKLDNYYIWCNWKFYDILMSNLPFKACIVWAKNNFGLGAGYRHQHEFCLFNGDLDSDIKNESDLWQINKDIQYMHPTQKPIQLAERALNNHSKANNILDLFGGSGSTLIACEKLNRTCYTMEIDPKYVDVIVKRWEDYTGKKAVLEQTGEVF